MKGMVDMNIDERYYSPNMHRVEKLMPKYSDFIDEYVAVRKTLGKYARIDGITTEEKAIIIEVIKTQYLMEVGETLDELYQVVANYSDERNGVLVGIEKAILEDGHIGTVADVLDNTNDKIEYLRETIYNLFSDGGYSVLHELTNNLKNEE